MAELLETQNPAAGTLAETPPLSARQRRRFEQFRELMAEIAARPSVPEKDFSLQKIQTSSSQIKASVIGNQWVKQAAKIGKIFLQEHKRESWDYGFSAPIGPSTSAAFFISCEEQQACDVAQRMAQKNDELRNALASGMPVPLIYGEDSGLHTAIGFAAGLKKVSAEANIKIVPMRDGESCSGDIKNAGLAIFCDSVIVYGRACGQFLRTLPKDRPINAIIYANKGYGSAKYGLNAMTNIKEAVGHHRLMLAISELDEPSHKKEFDPFDRADVIAYVNHPHLRKLQPLLLKRQVPNWGDNKKKVAKKPRFKKSARQKKLTPSNNG